MYPCEEKIITNLKTKINTKNSAKSAVFNKERSVSIGAVPCFDNNPLTRLSGFLSEQLLSLLVKEKVRMKQPNKIYISRQRLLFLF